MMDEKKEHGDKPKTVSDVFQKIHIALDGYDDIFSDFDPSDYENRIMSDDFINELRKRYAENRKGDFVITFSLSKSKRIERTETLIKRRIKEYFKNRLRDLEKNQHERMKKGIIRIAIGIAILIFFFLAALETRPFVEFFSIISWYLIWFGLENILESSARIQKRKNFMEKFTKAEYKFIDQEEAVALVAKLEKIEQAEQKAEAKKEEAKDKSTALETVSKTIKQNQI